MEVVPIMSQRRLNARRRHICLQSLVEGWKRFGDQWTPIYRHLPNDFRGKIAW